MHDFEKNKTLIIIGEGYSVKSIPNLDKDSTIITFQLEDEFEAKKLGFNAIYFHRFAQSKEIWESIISSAKSWLETWPKKQIHDELSALDVWKFKDVSLWWFIYDWAWETNNGIFDTIYQLKAFSSIIEDYKPKIVKVWGYYDYPVLSILKSLSKKYDFNIDSKNFKHKDLPSSFVNKRTYRIKVLTRLIILKLVNIFAKKTTKEMAFFSQHGGVLEKTTKENLIAADPYFLGLEDYIQNNKNKIKFISIDQSRLYLTSNKDFLKDLKRIKKGLYTPWFCYYSIGDIIKMWKDTKQYSQLISIIEKNPNFESSMVIEGISIYPFLRHIFTKSMPRVLALANLEIKTAQRFLKREKVKLIFTTYGLSISGKALAYVCNSNKTKILTPQLGIISPQFPVNTTLFISKEFDKRLILNYLVWGPFYEDLITSRGYPKSLVKQIGFWRSEKRKLSGSEESNYVLYIAGANLKKLFYVQTVEEEIFTIKQIRRVLPKDLNLVVKLHPSLPYSLYQNKLKGFEKISLVEHDASIDINELIRSALVIIGKGTTVIIQSIILEKPVIVVNFSSNLDFIGIEGIPFINNPQDFAKKIKEMMSGEKIEKCNLDYYCHPIGKESVSLIIDAIEGKRNT